MPASPDEIKIEFLSSFCSLIEKRIERDLDEIEALALAFVVEKRWDEGRTPDQFLETTFHLVPNDSPFEASFKIHNAIFQAKMSETEARTFIAGADSEEAKKIEALKELMISHHEDVVKLYEYGEGEIPLGAVALYWLPQWARSRNF